MRNVTARVYGSLIVCIIAMFLMRFGLPEFLQGATSQTGQNIMEWITTLERYAEVMLFF